MTVEELLIHEHGLQSKLVATCYEAKIEAIKSNFEKIKEALWQTHRDAVAGDFKENLEFSVAFDDLYNNKKKPTSKKAPVKVGGRLIDPTLPLVRVKCIAAQENHLNHYVGKEWMLQPGLGKPCKIGRSKGIHFINKGVSLSEDLEVSTSHGEFGMSKKTHKLYYKDMGSSNGSYIVDSETNKELDEQLTVSEEYDLVSGMVMRFGVCIFEITLPSHESLS
jgi:hypothetical protein